MKAMSVADVKNPHHRGTSTYLQACAIYHRPRCLTASNASNNDPKPKQWRSIKGVWQVPMGQTTKTSKFAQGGKRDRRPTRKKHFFPWLYARSTAKVRWFQVFHCAILQISCCQVRQEEGNLGPSKVPTCQILLVSQAWWVWIAKGPGVMWIVKEGKILFKLYILANIQKKCVWWFWVENLCSMSQKLENFSPRSPGTWRVKGVVIPLTAPFLPFN